MGALMPRAIEQTGKEQTAVASRESQPRIRAHIYGERPMLKFLALLACCALAVPAYADGLRDGDQHELPTHKAWGQWHDTIDVIEDPAHGAVCYVARQNDSHAMQMQCVKVKP